MDTKVVLALGGGLAIGTIIGFGVGYYISGAEIEDKYLGEVEFLNDELRKYRDLLKDYESKDPVQEKKTTIPQDATKSKEPSKREMDTHKTDYTKYNKPYEYQSTPIDIPDSPPEDEPEEDPEEDEGSDEYVTNYDMDSYNDSEYDEMYQENEQAYIDKYGDMIQILGDECSHDDFPDFRYRDYSELHIFTDDGVMTDDQGNVVDEKEYVGETLRRTHWLEGDKDRVWVRNNPKEHDFLVNRHRVSSEDYWVRGIDG